jgi:hypothetical protein
MTSIDRVIALAALTLVACGTAEQSATGQEVSVGTGTESITIDSNATYQLVGVQSGKCVEVSGASTSNLATLQIATCVTDKRQQFRFESSGSGYYRLRNVNSGLCADVEGYSQSDGARAIQYTCGAGYNQQWSIANVSSGIERLTARHSGKALVVANAGTSDGTRLQQSTYDNRATQQFRLQVVGAPDGAGGTGSAGTGGTAGTAGSGDTGGTSSSDKVFSQCRFHFGTIDSYARNNAAIRAEIDYFTPGWMGTHDAFDQTYVCNDTKAGGPLFGKVPVIVAYVAAFYVKRHYNLCDCNVSSCGAGNDLCHYGSQYIQENLNAILNVYKSYAQGYANCYGTSKPIVFEMEPDWYQYTYSDQTKPMTPAQASSLMNQFVSAIKQYLPNARFSMDLSPWVAPNNGSDNGQQWFSNFNMGSFSFVNTSGGSTEAANTKLRSTNNMTWSGVSGVSGKPILADTGYGANGAPAGHDANWDNPTYLNARMKDGVIGISQYNPSTNWGSTIQSIRSQLGTPKFCL